MSDRIKGSLIAAFFASMIGISLLGSYQEHSPAFVAQPVRPVSPSEPSQANQPIYGEWQPLEQASTDTRPAPSESNRRAAIEILFFTSDTCGPCKYVEPVMAAYEQAGWHVRTVNLTHHGREEYQNRRCNGTPTVIVLRDGAEVLRLVGGPLDTDKQSRLAQAVLS